MTKPAKSPGVMTFSGKDQEVLLLVRRQFEILHVVNKCAEQEENVNTIQTPQDDPNS